MWKLLYWLVDLNDIKDIDITKSKLKFYKPYIMTPIRYKWLKLFHLIGKW